MNEPHTELDLRFTIHDHTFVQSLVYEGRLTAEEAAPHPQRATLQCALNSDGTTEPDLHLCEAHPGNRYLLRSDGLHAVIEEQQLHEALATASTPQQAADRFIDLANNRGGPDNVACVIVDAVARS